MESVVKDTISVMVFFPILVDRLLILIPFRGLSQVLNDVFEVRANASENKALTICHRGQSSDFIRRSGSEDFRH